MTIKYRIYPGSRLQLGKEGGLIFLPLDDFRGKVQERTPKLFQVLPSCEPGTQAEVDEFDVASGIHLVVLHLQVLMPSALLVAVVHHTCNLPEESPGLFLLHATGLLDVVP